MRFGIGNRRTYRAGLIPAMALGAAALILGPVCGSHAQPFRLPTTNTFIYQQGAEDKYFVGTVGKPWQSGTYGCVRTEGYQLHEGLDIRNLARDRKGEPLDDALAAADGEVAYINTRTGLSNFGNYLILRHRIEGIEIYTLYSHLRSIRPGLKRGDTVRAGEVIAGVGRTTNTRQAISKERAHLHFEICLLINDRFNEWHKKKHAGERNDHGDWNGQNLVGLDPWAVFQQQRTQGPRFRLADFIQSQPEMCRVAVRNTAFPWLRRYPMLVTPNPKAQAEGIAGYELVLNFAGLPIQAIPRAASELKSREKIALLSVNEAEQRKNPCRKLVTRTARGWQLTNNGHNLLDLLTF